MAALLMAPQAWAQRIELLAGSTQGYAEGTGAAAQFNDLAGLAVDANGTVYVNEWGGQRIRKIAPNGSTSLLAGSTSGDQAQQRALALLRDLTPRLAWP